MLLRIFYIILLINSQGDYDTIKNPSSQLVLGLPASVGTGSFDVVHDVTL